MCVCVCLQIGLFFASTTSTEMAEKRKELQKTAKELRALAAKQYKISESEFFDKMCRWHSGACTFVRHLLC